MSSYAAVKLYRAKHTAAGLCVSCTKKVIPGRIRCKKHLAQVAKACSANYNRRKTATAEVSSVPVTQTEGAT